MASAPKGLQFLCVKCQRHLDVTQDSPLNDSTVLAFQSSSAFSPQEKGAVKSLAESFVVLPASAQSDAKADRHRQFETLTKVFQIASDKSQLDHPLCKNCSESIVKELEKRISESQNDLTAYRKTLAQLTTSPGPLPPDPKHKATLDAEEKALLEELAQVKRERQQFAAELDSLVDEAKELDQLESTLWDQYRRYQIHLNGVSQDQMAVQQSIEVVSEQLERAKRTNVYDDAFHIYYDGHFGTINGFRLGKLPSQPVKWPEINAALGQVVLLLKVVASQCNFKFTKYRPIPMGSFSKMAKSDDPSTEYELYCPSESQFSKLFWYRRFDAALAMLLHCVKEFGDHAHKLDNKFSLKYKIDGDMIQGLSIKANFNNDANWTKALKYMLTNLKFLLAWASRYKDH